MSALKPGLYRATVRGVPDVMVQIGDDGYGFTARQSNGAYLHPDGFVTDARPLIVLDLVIDDRHYRPGPSTLADFLRGTYPDLADQIERQTKPARIPEPSLWGVVLAAGARDRIEWVRTVNGWSNGYHCHPWSYLIDPTLVREGVES